MLFVAFFVFVSKQCINPLLSPNKRFEMSAANKTTELKPILFSGTGYQNISQRVLSKMFTSFSWVESCTPSKNGFKTNK